VGATLRYAKVVDRESFQRSGAQVRPGLDSHVALKADAPGPAAPFYILRAWDHVDAGFTETWRIVEPYGRTVREGVAREVLAEHGDLADEIDDQEFEYSDEGYQLVLEVDGREVARVDFPVVDAPAE
jgi:hypothetical protein